MTLPDSATSHDRASGIPPDIARRIRAAGPVIDMTLTQTLYEPLLAAQRRDGVEVEHDRAYGSDARHRLDLYRPQDAGQGLLPVLLFLHGGGFIRGDKHEKENIGLYFARNGFIVAVANYRLAPKDPWPCGAQDTVAAFEWLRANVGAAGGDRRRIFLMGESAGAAHVAAATLLRRFQPATGLPVAGVVLISGVYNPELEALARRQFGVATPDPRNDAYFGSDPARYSQMSIVRNIDAPPVPLLITYASLDPPQMQVQAGELFAALIARHGFDAELHVVQDHNHLTQVYAINTGDESLSRHICEFLRRHDAGYAAS